MTASLAHQLADAVRTRTAIPPLTDEHDLDLAAAYRLQDAAIALLDPDAGHDAIKLGLTSRAKQEQMSVHEPISGRFLPGSALDAGEMLETASLIQPRAEPEIALLLGEPLEGAHTTTVQVLAATAAVLPALDVLDSRYAGYRFRLPDVVADNASAARYVLGDPVAADGIDLGRVGCVFERNGEVVDTAAGAAVLGHPAAAVAWYVRSLAARGGQGLAAGSVVLAGALTAAVPLQPGDTVRATIDRIGSVALTCR